VSRKARITKKGKPVPVTGRSIPPPTAARPIPKHPGVDGLSSKHRKTLKMIFAKPTRSDVRWSDIEALIRALGGEISSGSGSRRRIFLIRPAVFHMPHPNPMTDKGAVKDMRGYLASVGIRP
jgi:hypothetical protein